MIEAELFDGTILEFPEGTDPAVIQRVVKEQTMQRRSATSSPTEGRGAGVRAERSVPVEEDSLLSTIMGYAAPVGSFVDQSMRGVAEGIVNIAGLPQALEQGRNSLLKFGAEKAGISEYADPVIDAITMGRNLPSADNMKGWLNSANDATADALGVSRPDQTPDNMAERFANRIGQEVGAALPIVGPIARAGSAMSPQRAREIGGVVGGMLEPYAVNTGRALANDATLIAAAGTGASIAREMNPDSDLADLLGSLAGVGVVTAGSSIANFGRQLGAAMRPNSQYASQTVRDAVTDTIANRSETLAGQITPENMGQPIDTGPLAEALASASRAEQMIPGFRASTADRAQDGGLATLEAARASSTSGSPAFTRRADENAAAVDTKFSGMAPSQTPGAAFDAIRAERDRRFADAGAMTRMAEDDLIAAITGVRPGMPDATARGSTARSALEDAYQAARTKVTEAYAPINDATVSVDAAPLAERFAQTTDSLPLNDRQRFLPAEARVPEQFVTPEVPPTPSAVLGPDGRPLMRPGQSASGEVPLREITSIRSGLTDDVRTAKATGQDQKARVADQFRSQADQFLDEAMPPELRQQYEAARATRKDVADRFERPGTALQRVLQRREGGGYQLDDSAVTRQFTPTDQGNLTDFRDALREAGGDSRLRNAIADEIVVEAERSGVMAKPEALRQFLSERSLVLEQFPELRQKLGSVADRQQAVDTAKAGEQTLQRDLGTDTQRGRTIVGKFASYSPVKARQAVKEIYAERDPVKAADDLASFVGDDPEAIGGLRAAFWEDLDASARAANVRADTKSGTMPIVPKKLLGFLNDKTKAAVAERLYRDDPEHLANIRQLAEALQGVNTAPRARNATNPSGTAFKAQGDGISAAEVQSKLYQARIGRISPGFIGLFFAQKLAARSVGRQQANAFENLLDKALLDPEVARGLLMENNPANRAAFDRMAKGWLGNQAATLSSILNEDDQGDETVDTIMREKQ
ncbi:MAG: hypothetical protein ACOVN5_07100 [Aquidulcibacter sp.]